MRASPRPSVDRGRGLARVTARAVAASQLVQDRRAVGRHRVRSAAPRCRPAHPVGVETRWQLDEPGDVVDERVRVRSAIISLTGHAPRRPRGDGTGHPGGRAAGAGLADSCRAPRGGPKAWQVFATHCDRVREHIFVAVDRVLVRAASNSVWGELVPKPLARSQPHPDDDRRRTMSFDSSSRMRSALTIFKRSCISSIARTSAASGFEARSATNRARATSQRSSSNRSGCAGSQPAAHQVEPTVVRVDELWSRAVRIVEGHRHRVHRESRGRDRGDVVREVTSGLRSPRVHVGRKVVISKRSPSFSNRLCRSADRSTRPRRPTVARPLDGVGRASVAMSMSTMSRSRRRRERFRRPRYAVLPIARRRAAKLLRRRIRDVETLQPGGNCGHSRHCGGGVASDPITYLDYPLGLPLGLPIGITHWITHSDCLLPAAACSARAPSCAARS